MHVANCRGAVSHLVHGGIPIAVRISAGFGAALAVRWVAWLRKPDDLFMSMDEAAAWTMDINDRILRVLGGRGE
jgi:hypothetical protein